MTTPTGHILIGKHVIEATKEKGLYQTLAEFNVNLEKLQLPNGFEFGFDQIIALGGDFYGDASQPISFGKNVREQLGNFENAFATLAQPPKQQGIMKKIIQLIRKFQLSSLIRLFKKEEKDIDGYIASGRMPHDYYHTCGKSLSDTIKYSLAKPDYLALALTNFDHFNGNNQTAYLIGHQLAMTIAAAARNVDGSTQTQILNEAFAIEAFACHFLTDSFSAGHLRVPRFAIYDHYKKVGACFATIRSAKQALDQHNKDGEKRLFAQVKLEDRNDGKKQIIKLVGDEYFCDDHLCDCDPKMQATLDSTSAEISLNAALTTLAAVKAVTAGMQEVFAAFTSPNAVSTKMEDYFPHEVADRTQLYAYKRVAASSKSKNEDIATLELQLKVKSSTEKQIIEDMRQQALNIKPEPVHFGLLSSNANKTIPANGANSGIAKTEMADSSSQIGVVFHRVISQVYKHG